MKHMLLQHQSDLMHTCLMPKHQCSRTRLKISVKSRRLGLQKQIGNATTDIYSYRHLELVCDTSELWLDV